MMLWYSAGEDAISWVGCYISIVSILCTIPLIIEAVRAYQQAKRWLPIYTIDTVFIIIMQTLMLPVDVATDLTIYNINLAKFVNILYFFVFLANSLPSLGVMNDNQLCKNLIALAILIFNYIFNLLTTEGSRIPTMLLVVIIFIILFPFPVALVVPPCRDTMMKQLLRLPPHRHSEIEYPQFVIAYSHFVSLSGIICTYFAVHLLGTLISTRFGSNNWHGSSSDYNWWMELIIFSQTIGIVVGTITLVFRSTAAFIFNDLKVFYDDPRYFELVDKWKSQQS